MVGGYKELQAAIFNADTALPSAVEYCTLQKNTEPCSRTLQAAAHTLVLIAVRCCANAVEMLWKCCRSQECSRHKSSNWLSEFKATAVGC